jgi:hypothetical protein
MSIPLAQQTFHQVSMIALPSFQGGQGLFHALTDSRRRRLRFRRSPHPHLQHELHVRQVQLSQHLLEDRTGRDVLHFELDFGIGGAPSPVK